MMENLNNYKTPQHKHRRSNVSSSRKHNNVYETNNVHETLYVYLIKHEINQYIYIYINKWKFIHTYNYMYIYIYVLISFIHFENVRWIFRFANLIEENQVSILVFWGLWVTQRFVGPRKQQKGANWHTKSQTHHVRM